MAATEEKSLGYYFRQIGVCKPKILLGLGMFFLVLYFLMKLWSEKYHDVTFDYLLFTQRWLPTACIQYVEKPSPSTRRCTLPSNFKMWGIHGLWPTENRNMGPFFCNTSMKFDLDALEPIKSDLIAYWPNIQGNADYSSLWRHEWEKHGTCAAQLDSLNTEIKYFRTSLGFYKKYNIQNVLDRNGISPLLSRGYFLSDLFSPLQRSFGKMPQIYCIYEAHTHQPYLFEIRMCFSKDLNLIDCTDYHDRNGRVLALTNCPRDRPIIYPDTLTPPQLNKEYLKSGQKDFGLPLFDLQLIRLVQ